MEHVQTQLIDYYPPLLPPQILTYPHPFPTPFGCFIAPITTPILVPIVRFLLTLSEAISNIYNHQNDNGTNHCHLNDRSLRKNARQTTPQAKKYATYRPLAQAERKV